MKERIEYLVKVLNEASDTYYNSDTEIMSNYEWDALFDELKNLEKETGIILPNSPTQVTGSNVNEGTKITHEYPAKSLNKTKSIDDLKEWIGDETAVISWKLDGLTTVATYDNGKLSLLATRGNGIVGQDITFMAENIKGIPMKIPYNGHLVVRGESTITYEDFEKINDTIENEDEKYKNPRNLASGTLNPTLKDISIVKDRCVHFTAFTLVHIDEEIISWTDRMSFLEKLDFSVVDHEKTSSSMIEKTIEKWTEKVKDFADPVDGLVIVYNDTRLASEGSSTQHHDTNAGLAFKWQDKPVETILDHIEWSCAMSVISPVAVFDPVEIEGTTVTRASLCNISEIKRLKIGANRKTKLNVIKANMIIPKIVSCDAQGTENMFNIPCNCPVCNSPTEVKISQASGTETLICTNPDCLAKQIKKMSRFVSKDGLNIDGLSEQKLNFLVNHKYIENMKQIISLNYPYTAFGVISNKNGDNLSEEEGWGEQSVSNLINSIRKSIHTDLQHVLYALSIPQCGHDVSKKLIETYGSEELIKKLIEKTISFDEICKIDGIGPVKAQSFIDWFSIEENHSLFVFLTEELNIKKEEKKQAGGSLEGYTFVITGDVHIFANRNEFKKYVEKEGGKVAGSVSKKTSFLVNNDVNSTSGKNKSAKELGIQIISEDEFVERFGK